MCNQLSLNQQKNPRMIERKSHARRKKGLRFRYGTQTSFPNDRVIRFSNFFFECAIHLMMQATQKRITLMLTTMVLLFLGFALNMKIDHNFF